MKVKRQKTSLEKLKFWDRTFKVAIIFLIISFASVFIVPEEYFEADIFIYPWLILFFGGMLAGITFELGMIYHSAKLKRYGWFLATLFLGAIFSIIFYFTILRKEFKGQTKSI